jgi:cobalt-precorrin 5A hydrolase/precorrin-3B C17-methyltransferase
MRSPQATRALIEATDWVGYGPYLDLAGDLRRDQREHRFDLGAEEERVRRAIALAEDGRRVALVCSGDPGIYAMAALVEEIIEETPSRIAIEIVPGISAVQVAAAKAGAMIGHDFCCISLSDLLTPWNVIERRVKAAAEGDFVVAFYNPRSQKRRDQLVQAIELLAEHRPEATPVIVAGRLGRPGESVAISTLGSFDPAEVDMLSLVIVGSSQSRTFKRGDGQTYAYTPRGYAAKREVRA